MTQETKVLIVDDEAPIRAILTRWLNGWGYGTRDVGSALEALDVMVADPAAILLCDVNMPKHDGLWLAEQVQVCWPRTAIIMSTALTDPQTVWTSRNLGAVAYVTKPYDPNLLRQALDRASGQLRFRPSAEPQTHARPDTAAPRRGPNGAIEHPRDMSQVLQLADDQLVNGEVPGVTTKEKQR